MTFDDGCVYNEYITHPRSIIMGAGNQKDHHIQDLAEIYAVLALLLKAIERNCAITDDSSSVHQEYVDYLNNIDGLTETEFLNSPYRKNVDKWVDNIITDLQKVFPNEKFDFVNCEVENRNAGKKGDIKIIVSNGSSKSVSLKNYKKGFKNGLQGTSNTWISGTNQILFDSCGGGRFYHPNHPKDPDYAFNGSNTVDRNKILEEIGLAPMIPVYDFYEETLTYIKTKYRDSEWAKYFTPEVAKVWTKDSNDDSEKAIKLTLSALDLIPNELIKKSMIERAGLDGTEELLLLSEKKYLFSLSNDDYKKKVKRANGKDTKVVYYKHKLAIYYELCDSEGVIATIKQPFSYQRNGCWAWVEDYPDGFTSDMIAKMDEHGRIPYDSGGKKSKDKGTPLAWGERRPKKSREINTSANVKLHFKFIFNN